MAATAATLQGEVAMGEVVATVPVAGTEAQAATVAMREGEVATEAVEARDMAGERAVLGEMEDTRVDAGGMAEEVEMAESSRC
jgi:hypothetical protein